MTLREAIEFELRLAEALKCQNPIKAAHRIACVIRDIADFGRLEGIEEAARMVELLKTQDPPKIISPEWLAEWIRSKR